MKLDLSLRQQYQALRRSKKIKLKYLAIKVGVSVPMLSMYENEFVNLRREKENKYIESIITYRDDDTN
ncbi:hypothetical protein PMSD_03775 [Paenibacillus macquariensis subsp. defensor]|nr:hypothetical protein PMSD_03775 [Paenibacillus macquariensis subsp. defensor]